MFSLMSSHQAMPQMRANAERALELDPSLPDGHALLGIVAALYEYDWTESAREFGIAMGREPVPPWVRNVYLIGQPLRDSPWWPALAQMMNLPQSELRNASS